MIKEHSHKYSLTAGETDAQSRMPMTLIFERAIEVATEHANELGIGYSTLIQKGVGWVLTRMSVQMIRYPKINEEYTFVTWVEGINRLYSDRCFVILDANRKEIGHIRSMWVAIDMEKRTTVDLSQFDSEAIPISDRKCPVPPQKKLRMVSKVTHLRQYTFMYSDIDFNRHVNTVQYLRQLLNQWDMKHYDKQQISKLQIAFHKECYCGETVDICVEEEDNNSACCAIVHGETRCVAATVDFVPRTE